MGLPQRSEASGTGLRERIGHGFGRILRPRKTMDGTITYGINIPIIGAFIDDCRTSIRPGAAVGFGGEPREHDHLSA